MAGSNHLLEFLKKVGTGQRGADHLSYDEAYAAMGAILDGAYDPVTLGAFLMAERWKPETAEELAGFTDAMRERSVLPEMAAVAGAAGVAGTASAAPAFGGASAGLLDCAGNFDGKDRTVNVSVPATIIAVAAGQPILCHGAESVPTKAGLTPAHVLKALGIATGATPAAAAASLAACRVAYLHQPDYNPGLHALLPQRWAMGKRTFLNTIEPLANPAGAAIHVGGCFHPPFAERVCQALARSRQGVRRALIFQGIEGMDELRPGRSLVAELRDGEVTTYPVEAEALGLSFSTGALALAGEGVAAWAEQSARWTEALLAAGQGDGPEGPGDSGGLVGFRHAVLLSAALRLYAGGRAGTWEEGVRMAKEALASGAARETLEAWRRAAPVG